MKSGRVHPRAGAAREPAQVWPPSWEAARTRRAREAAAVSTPVRRTRHTAWTAPLAVARRPARGSPPWRATRTSLPPLPRVHTTTTLARLHVGLVCRRCIPVAHASTSATGEAGHAHASLTGGGDSQASTFRPVLAPVPGPTPSPCALPFASPPPQPPPHCGVSPPMRPV